MEKKRKHIRAITQSRALPEKAQFIPPLQIKKEAAIELVQLFIDDKRRP